MAVYFKHCLLIYFLWQLLPCAVLLCYHVKSSLKKQSYYLIFVGFAFKTASQKAVAEILCSGCACVCFKAFTQEHKIMALAHQSCVPACSTTSPKGLLCVFSLALR